MTEGDDDALPTKPSDGVEPQEPSTTTGENSGTSTLRTQTDHPDGAHDVGVIRTLDGDEVGDEFAQDALNYQILLGKIDDLLENLALDA